MHPLLIAAICAIVLAGCDKIPGKSASSSAPATAAAPTPALPVASAPAVAGSATQAPSAALATGDSGASLEVRSHVKQAFAYIAAAKNATSKTNFNENIENAINEFDQAIAKDPNYAEAYSNRGVAYMQQKKFNKAQDSLQKAVELAPKNAAAHYNLASLYSLQGNVDLALDEIDTSLKNGFTDYDALRRDPDLDNVRRQPEFRKVLEKHKVFIVR